ncbi:MAG TPA: hypothetical protein VG269_09670 [Tepidisphaeraceae bacterium]|jgi:hypothetical protein|nr:hypothetical protein [Tepidisphaeraceae bacterium]
MEPLISEIEVLAHVGHVARKVAEKLRIKDFDWLPTVELLTQIDKADSKARGHLGSFISAYRHWYAFHREMDQVGKQGFLNSHEAARLVNLVGMRDKTRRELADYVKLLP